MPRHACPICHDPNAYPFWIDQDPPSGCPQDVDDDGNLAWANGGQRRVVELCEWQRSRAWQAAEFRKLVPDAFDQNGKILPGQIVRVITAFGEAHPCKALVG